MAQLPDGFIEVPAMLLVAESAALMDISIFMPLNAKVVLYKHLGDQLSLSDVSHLRQHSTAAVMKKADYDGAMQRLSGALTDVAKSAVGRDLAKTILSTSMTRDPEAPPEVKRAQLDAASDLATFVLTSAIATTKSSYYEKILAQLKNNDAFATHNRHVGALASMILMAIGSTGISDVADITFAGFFHDLFLAEMPAAISEMHLSGEDLGTLVSKAPALNLYAHVTKLMEKFDAEKVPATAAAMRAITQHHENFDGSGLKGARGEAIFRLARVLRVADDMICLVNSPTKKHSLATAYAFLENFNTKMQTPVYDPEVIAQLAPVFG